MIIDIHTHPPEEDYSPERRVFQDAMDRYFGSEKSPTNLEEFMVPFDEAKIDKIVVLALDSFTNLGWGEGSNDYVSKLVESNPDRLIGFASVDPWKGKLAIKELERAVRELHMKGLKMHPITQAFFPNDTRFYPIYQKCVELKLPITFHCGMAASGVGLAGGGGLKLKYSNPMYLDDVAADFPELKIIMAHPAFPWTEEQIAIAMHKPNAFIDLSGWRPKYFPQVLRAYMKTKIISEKLLFGSDFPAITPKVWLRDFEQFSLSREIKEKILHQNAEKILSL